jgi:hypothetical protein
LRLVHLLYIQHDLAVVGGQFEELGILFVVGVALVGVDEYPPGLLVLGQCLPRVFQLEIGLAEREVDVSLNEGEAVLVYVVGDGEAAQVVLVEFELVEFRRHPHQIIAIPSVLRHGVEQVEIGELLVNKGGDDGGVLAVGVALLVDHLLDVVIERPLDEVLVEYPEPVQEVKDVDEIAMQFVFMDARRPFEHQLVRVALDRLVHLQFVVVAPRKAVQGLAQLDHLAEVVEDKLVPIAVLELLRQTLVQLHAAFVVSKDEHNICDFAALALLQIVRFLQLGSALEEISNPPLDSVALLISLA